MKRFLSSPFFLIALLCFFLPFFAVTCAGLGSLSGIPGADQAEEATTLTGVEFLTGQAEEDLENPEEITGGGFPGSDLFPIPGPSPSIPVPTEPEQAEQAVDLGTSQIWAIAAAAVALLGLFLALMAGRAGGVMALALGVIGAILLFLLAGSVKSAVDDAVGAEAAGIIQVENKMGFWLALGAFIVAALTGLIRLLLPDREEGGLPPEAAGTGFGQPAAPPGTPPAAPPPPE